MLKRRRGRRPKIEKLLEASAIESAMAASGGNMSANHAGPVPPTGMVGNLLWPAMSSANFEQYINRLADAAGLSADSRRMFISELSRAANLDERSFLSGGFSGDAAGPVRNENGVSKPEEPSASETERRVKEVVSSVKRAHQLDVEAATTQPRMFAADDSRHDDDRDGMPKIDRKSRAAAAAAARDSPEEDAELQQPMNLVSGEHDIDSDKEQSNATDRDRSTRANNHEHGLADRDQSQRGCPPPEDLSRDHSRFSAGEEEEDMLMRARMNQPEHEAVSRWLAEHRNAFDRQAVEDEVQSEVCNY